jgi:hypothetical protein
MRAGEFFWWTIFISGCIAFWYISIPIIILLSWYLKD